MLQQYLPAIVQAVAHKRALILVAEPGSGKTTQVPWALSQGLHASDLTQEKGRVLVLEPRRLAARLAARFVAQSHDVPLGGAVGYRVRHEDVTSNLTRLVYMTQGLLWRTMVAAPELPGVSCVVFDEFHDRSLAQDLILGALVQRRSQGHPGPAIVIMSATLAHEAVRPLLPDAPVMHLPGRQYPVTTEHLPHDSRERLEVQVARGVAQVMRRDTAAIVGPGHILTFLPGQADIARAARACESLARQHALRITPLHASLPPDQQDAAVAPSTGRRLILATNVAETSLTIEGVATVVDTGLAKISHVDPMTGIGRLQTGPVSQAAAVQRAGRAGRTGPGHCLRLYTAINFRRRAAFELPDIVREDLAEAVLWLGALGLPPLSQLPLIDRPAPQAIAQAEATLTRLGAWKSGDITPLGRQLLQFGVHPRLGRVVLGAHARGIGPLGCRAAAVLSLGHSAPSKTRPASGVTAGAGAALSVGPSDLEPLLAPAALGAEARQVARSLERSLKHIEAPAGGLSADAHAASQLLEEALLAGFSDRLTRRQPPLGPRPGPLPLALGWGGKGVLAANSCVRDSALVLALQAGFPGDRINELVVDMAHGISAENLLALDDGRLEEQVVVAVSPQHGRVEKLETLRYDGLVIDESRSQHVSSTEAQAALTQWLVSQGHTLLQATELLPDCAQLLARLQCAATGHDLGPLVVPPGDGLSGSRQHIPLPEEFKEAIVQTYRTAGSSCRSVAELRELPILRLLQESLCHPWQEAMRRLAPTHITLQSGAKLQVHYVPGQDPYVATYLQAFFGTTTGPRVGGAQRPLTLHLWGPNRQALQVTQDLANFWQLHYPKLRGALARRYPRHAWPEDPATATPPPERTRRRR